MIVLRTCERLSFELHYSTVNFTHRFTNYFVIMCNHTQLPAVARSLHVRFRDARIFTHERRSTQLLNVHFAYAGEQNLQGVCYYRRCYRNLF